MSFSFNFVVEDDSATVMSSTLQNVTIGAGSASMHTENDTAQHVQPSQLSTSTSSVTSSSSSSPSALELVAIDWASVYTVAIATASADMITAPTVAEVVFASPPSSLTSVVSSCPSSSSSESLRRRRRIPLHKFLLDADAVVSPLVDAKPVDVIPSVYEGGAKTWECTLDLIQYLEEHSLLVEQKEGKGGGVVTSGSSDERGCGGGVVNIVDLGCGSGLLGCRLLQQQQQQQQYAASKLLEIGSKKAAAAISLLFTDLNASVLQHVTAPNIAMNVHAAAVCLQHDESDSNDSSSDSSDIFTGSFEPTSPSSMLLTSSVKLLAGPWDDILSALLEQQQSSSSSGSGASSSSSFLSPDGLIISPGSIDILVSSETLYRIESYPTLCKLLSCWLHPEKGVAYFATKRYYYGVGGGSSAFMAAVQTQSEGMLEVERVAVFEDGKSMIRDILRVNRRRR